jgi:alkylhydroperoxidase/carboxymuconolactone decarboxylase family protein YurZ
MTLLNKSLNASISNKVFAEKVGGYKRRDAATQAGTTFPMTYSIYDDFVMRNEVWTRDKIKKRAEEWASLAVSIWPL